MNAFSESQLQDLRDLQRVPRGLGAEAVIIGAMAYRLFIEDAHRQTYDIDLAVALDLDEFEMLGEALTALEWRPQETQEQRWMTLRDNRFDLVPAASQGGENRVASQRLRDELGGIRPRISRRHPAGRWGRASVQSGPAAGLGPSQDGVLSG